MRNLSCLIELGIKKSKGSRPILAAPFDLEPSIYEPYFVDGKIAGVIVNSEALALSYSDSSRRGHWLDRQASRLVIDKSATNQMLFLGGMHQVSGRMLFELRCKGIRKLICLTEDGVDFMVVSVGKHFNSRVLLHVRQKLVFLPLARGLFKKRLENKGITFENAYADLRKYGRFLALSNETLPNEALSNEALSDEALSDEALSDEALSDEALSDEAFRKNTFENAYEDLRECGQFLALPNKAFHKNKILIMSGSLGPGGAERQIHYTARGLGRHKKLDVTVACSYLDPPGDFFKAGIEEAGVRVIRIPTERREFSDPEITELKQKLEKYNPLGFQNVLHQVIASALVLREERPALVHLWMDAMNVCAGIAAEIVGVPHIVLSGRSVAPDNFDIHQPYMHPGYLNLLKHGTPMMLNNSRAGAKDYARWLDIAVDRIKVVHNGMEFPLRPDEQQIAAFRKSHSLPEKAKVVGGILRFSEEKQPQLWIDTAAEVIKTRPDAMAIGFGGGEMLEKMRNYVELLGLQDRVLLPGVTDEAWLAAASMDVFVMTSRKEGFPNVLLEAQGMGVPVVCTATGGMPETYIEGETGISVPEATPKALARECLLLLDDNNRLQFMGKHAYEHVRKEYNVNRMVEETFRIYETTKSRAISHV